MNVNSSTLAAEHSVRHVGGAIAVCVADSKDASFVSSHSTSDLDLSVVQLKSHLSWESRGLIGGVVNQESIALNWLALREVHEELVILLVLLIIPVRTTILETLKGLDHAVINSDVPCLKLLVPVWVLGRSTSLAIGGSGAVGECDDVAVQCVDLQDGTKDVGNIGDNAKGLVTVL